MKMEKIFENEICQLFYDNDLKKYLVIHGENRYYFLYQGPAIRKFKKITKEFGD